MRGKGDERAQRVDLGLTTYGNYYSIDLWDLIQELEGDRALPTAVVEH